MRRIKSPTAVASRPAVPALTGAEGYFTNGNPGAGVPATVMPDWWLNMMQDEFLAILAAAGIAPDTAGTVNNQIMAALRAMFGGTGLLGVNSHMRLPGGMIAQYGFNSTEVGGNVNFAFPLTFPNACRIVLAMEASADGWGPGSCRVFGCNLKTQAGTIISSAVVTSGSVTFGSAAFFWLALGD
jgi:hypothetical protein